jgi:hypothetical protein
MSTLIAEGRAQKLVVTEDSLVVDLGEAGNPTQAKKEAMSKQRVNQEFPPGWDESRVRRALDYYESQTDEEAATEIRSALENTTMEVPTALVPVVRELIAKRKSVRARAAKRRKTTPQPASRSRRG